MISYYISDVAGEAIIIIQCTCSIKKSIKYYVHSLIKFIQFRIIMLHELIASTLQATPYLLWMPSNIYKTGFYKIQ